MNPIENGEDLKAIIEAALMAADEPLTVRRITELFCDKRERTLCNDPEKVVDGAGDGDGEENLIDNKKVKAAIISLQEDYAGKSLELIELASGFTFRVRKEYAPWITKLWAIKPPRYSRASLETLALIAYKQPITRAEIEEVRGVSVSSHIIKTLLGREWIKIIGHRDVPGRPALLATTKAFLDHFNLKRLDELPLLPAIEDLERELEKKGEQLEFDLQVALDVEEVCSS